jgi:hypothetical protein
MKTEITNTNGLEEPGFSSRKFIFGIATSILIAACGCLAGYWPSFSASLTTVIGGLVSIFAIYSGANVAQSFSPAAKPANNDGKTTSSSTSSTKKTTSSSKGG